MSGVHGCAGDLGADDTAPMPPAASVGVGMPIVATTYDMQTFHQFLAKKAVVLPDLFRIQPFVGLAQPIKLTPPTERTPKARRRLGSGPRPPRIH